MYLSHEIQLQLVIVADDPIETGNRVMGGEQHCLQGISYPFQLTNISRRFAEHEIEVHCCHRSPVQCCCSVSDKDGFQTLFTQGTSYCD
ncbi:MAG: hypothetical protein QOJ99_2796 [Bryobacterales bacterium]|nr:hypothetical protein [Bryobacterales bacterium]